VWKYVLRNSLVSTVTQIGLLFGILRRKGDQGSEALLLGQSPGGRGRG
jgi:hypothetical protein